MILATSIFAQDFLPYYEELSPGFASLMKDNRIKTLNIESFKADKNHNAISNDPIWRESYEFNQEGQLVNVIAYNPEWQLTRKTNFAYNSKGEIQNIFETEITGEGDDAVTSNVTFFINRNDGRINFIDRFEKSNEHPKGAVTNKYIYSYDEYDFVKQVIDSVISPGYPNPSTCYYYEGRALAKKVHPNYTVTYEFDMSGLTTKEYLQMLTSNYVTTHDYDAMANRLSTVMEGDAYILKVFNSYNDANLQINAKRTFTLKENNSQEFEVTNYTYGTF